MEQPRSIHCRTIMVKITSKCSLFHHQLDFTLTYLEVSVKLIFDQSVVQMKVKATPLLFIKQIQNYTCSFSELNKGGP